MNLTYFDPTFALKDGTESASLTIRRKIEAWIGSVWFRDLLDLFHANIVLEDALDGVLKRLDAFSDRWDFRRAAREQGVPADDARREGLGAARWLTSDGGFSRVTSRRILEDARHLGLVEARDAVQEEYDYILVLGGARLSCKLRSLRAAEVMKAGVRAGTVGLLGAARPIADTERDATDTYAPNAVDELDLLVAGGHEAFDFDERSFDEERYDDSKNTNNSWVWRRYQATLAGQVVHLVAMSAPSSNPALRRANSADTLAFFLDRENVPPNQRLLLITSQIYVPYVQIEALRTVALPRQLSVETIGFPGDRMSELQGLSSPNHYLQEIRSAIQAARRFCQAYPE